MEQEKNYKRKMINIYDIIAQGFILNDETLIMYSFTKEEIKELISLSILIPIDSNRYKISTVNELYQYGLRLLSREHFQKAIRCFQECCILEPNNREYCLRLLLMYLKEKNYNDALKLSYHIETIAPQKYQFDNILYIYLLNMLSDCDNEHYYKLQNLDPDEYISNIKKNNYSSVDFEIRKSIILNKFKYAFKLLSDQIRLQLDYSIETKVFREILCQTVTKEEQYKSDILLLIEKDKYQDILNLLNKKRKYRYLNSREMYIYLITESLIKISETRIIPIPTIASTRYTYDAIKGNNFNLAQDLNSEFIISTSKNLQKDPIDMLLNKINNLILEIKLDVENEEKVKEESNDEIDTKYLLSGARKQEKYEKKLQEPVITYEESVDEQQLSFAEELAYYIKAEHLSIENARKQLGVIPSQILLIKLIYARDYFIEGMDELGNKLLKEVELSKDKTKEVRKLLTEITKNKKSYKMVKKENTRKKLK